MSKPIPTVRALRSQLLLALSQLELMDEISATVPLRDTKLWQVVRDATAVVNDEAERRVEVLIAEPVQQTKKRVRCVQSYPGLNLGEIYWVSAIDRTTGYYRIAHDWYSRILFVDVSDE